MVAMAVMVTLAHNISPEIILYFPPLHVSTFLLGILIAKLQICFRERNRAIPPSAWPTYTALGLSTTIFAAAILFTPTAFIKSPLGSTFIRDGFLAPVFCLLVWALSRENTFVSRWLSAKWLVVLGDASYGLYLIHFPVLHLAMPFLLNTRLHNMSLVSYALPNYVPDLSWAMYCTERR